MSDDGFVPMGDTVRVRIEEDLVIVRNLGMMTLADLNVVIDVYTQVRARHGALFAMYDCSRAEGMERAARQALTKETDPSKSANAIAIFGAPFAVRILGNMIERARVGLGRSSTGIRFFETEAQAREYLQDERMRLKTTR